MSASTSRTANHKVFLGITCIFAGTPVIKFGDVQLLEVFLFLHLLWLTLILIIRKFRAPLNSLWRSLGPPYAIFFLVSLLLALASLRFHFYPPLASEPFLKQPFVLSVARLAELFLGIFHMLYIATILKDSQATRLYAIRFYFWFGFASGIFVFLSLPFKHGLRATGLFNEGGPYGLYLISIIIAGLLLYRVGGLTKIQSVVAAPVILTVFIMSQSKAAVSACLFLFLLNIFIMGSIRRKISFVVVIVALAVSINAFTNLPDQVGGYITSYMLVQQAGGRIDQGVYGGFGGRVAGAVLLPRMLLAHPVTGIGLGNYPLLFNDPEYLQGLPATDVWELPGMGIAEYVAELGLPLFIYLFILLLTPAWMASRRKSLSIVLVFALVQPLVNLFGAQLNFYYPWICSGFALGFLNWKGSPKSTRQALRMQPAFQAVLHGQLR